MPKTIGTIINALLGIVNGWVNPTNVQADIDDALLLLTTAANVDPNLSFINLGLKYLEKAEAGIANLNAGQAAVIANVTLPASGPVEAGVYTVVMVKAGGPAATSLGL